MIKDAEGGEEGQEQVALRGSNPTQMYGPANFDHFANRNAKILQAKRKREIET